MVNLSVTCDTCFTLEQDVFLYLVCNFTETFLPNFTFSEQTGGEGGLVHSPNKAIAM